MVDLTQAEANQLLAMEKQRMNDDPHRFSAFRLEIPLKSTDQRERFLLDIGRGRIDLVKVKYQMRAREVVTLARLDFGGAPHRNPDGQEIPSPHIHEYREGYGTKWAKPLPAHLFPNQNDPQELFEDFLRYCHVVLPPLFEQELFV
ncbi:DUF6978 family protein [Telmatobacter bradus]|uniref:DUF6978 family protein n=1 Tax=Telmatobacter bradus TaxID=474953 RepID=UPI003B42FA80